MAKKNREDVPKLEFVNVLLINYILAGKTLVDGTSLLLPYDFEKK